MSRLTDLLEEHTAEAVWEAVNEVANYVDITVLELAGSHYGLAYPEFVQGADEIHHRIWSYIEKYNPNPDEE